MCHYTHTHVKCGHAQKILLEPSLCNCKLTDKMETADTANAKKSSTGESKKSHGKNYGEFKGELAPLKESWCPKCLVEQKAKIVDHFTAGDLGSVLDQVVHPGEPQIHPTKVHTKMPKAPKEPQEGNEIKDEYQVPKWDLKWDGKSRTTIKREIREYKMEMVYEIRALRDMAKHNGVDMNKLAEMIKQQTRERKAVEANNRNETLKKKQANVEKAKDEVIAAAKKRADIKKNKVEKHLNQQIECKARVIYRV